jgi:hypothetical protein
MKLVSELVSLFIGWLAFQFFIILWSWHFCRLAQFILRLTYSSQITSWSPQEMRVLRQCKVPQAEVTFVTVQRENIRHSKKEVNKIVTVKFKLSDVFS